MLNKIEMAPPDPILGLTEAFVKDTNEKKVNLGVGVYKDENGVTPVLDSVRTSAKRCVDEEKTKAYLPITGSAEYGKAVQALLFGEGHEIISSARAATAHTPGGTGGLRVAGDLINFAFPNSSIWLSDPTWANHGNIFTASGVALKKYPYYNADKKALAFDQMIEALNNVPAGDVVLLHGCCHNPSGMDPDIDQWKVIAEVAAKIGFLPLVDFAYQGLGNGLEEDAAGLRVLCEKVPELLVVSSFSKNFGLYRERVGAFTIVADDQANAAKAMSQAKRLIRCNYSNPPCHGAAIVTTILNDSDLRKQWEDEVTDMRNRINGMRTLVVETLKAKGVERDFSFIEAQRGMFSFSGLTKDQVEFLKAKYSIYIVGSGRINVAGMTPGNIDYLCEAIADALKQ